MQAGEEGAGAGGAGWSEWRVSFGLFDPHAQPAATDAQARDSLAMWTQSAWSHAQDTDVRPEPQAGAGAHELALGSVWAAGQDVSGLSAESIKADGDEGHARGGAGRGLAEDSGREGVDLCVEAILRLEKEIGRGFIDRQGYGW